MTDEAFDDRLADALLAVGQGLHLPETLEAILAAAVDLSGATYGALAVVGRDGRIVRLLVHGGGVDVATQLGSPPLEAGVIGGLWTDLRKVSPEDLRRHAASAGFPEFRPETESLLGVPVHAGAHVFGHLLLADKEGAFTSRDEHRLTALASAAGIAVYNAQLYERTRRRERLQSAVAELGQAALRGEDTGEILQLLAMRARLLTDADAAIVAVPHEGSLVIEVVDCRDGCADPDSDTSSDPPTTHVDMTRWLGHAIPEASLLNRAFSARETVITDELDLDPEADRLTDSGHAVAALPLAAPDESLGLMVLAWREARLGVEREHLSIAEAFATQASIILSLDRSRRDREQLLIFRDRDRIARDLHDLVVQHLFATGMSLQVVLRTPDLPQPAAVRVLRAAKGLDEIIAEIRGTILRLKDSPEGDATLLHRLESEVGRATDSLGFEPLWSVGERVGEVDEALFDDVVAVIREGLSNVAKHARADHVEVRLDRVGDELLVVVHDDGQGLSADASRHSGLRNLAARAHRHGGDCSVTSGESVGGTALVWRVPGGGLKVS